MRTVELTNEEWEAVASDPMEGYDYQGLEVQVIDLKECSDAALEAFDHLLEAKGFQVVKFESGGDCFVFAIEEKGK